MNFGMYKPTELEQWINKQYRNNNIYYPDDMDIDVIASIFNVEIHLYDGRPFADWQDGEYSYIILNAYMHEEQKREHFFHELCHPLKHVGRQRGRNVPALFAELQEIQAAQFQLYAALPIYMIEQIAADVFSWSGFMKHLAEAFRLPIPFIKKRLDQIQNRIYWEQQEQDRRSRIENTPKVTDEHVRNVIAELARRQREYEGA